MARIIRACKSLDHCHGVFALHHQHTVLITQHCSAADKCGTRDFCPGTLHPALSRAAPCRAHKHRGASPPAVSRALADLHHDVALIKRDYMHNTTVLHHTPHCRDTATSTRSPSHCQQFHGRDKTHVQPCSWQQSTHCLAKTVTPAQQTCCFAASCRPGSCVCLWLCFANILMRQLYRYLSKKFFLQKLIITLHTTITFHAETTLSTLAVNKRLVNADTDEHEQ